MLGDAPIWPAKAPAERSDYGLRWTKYMPVGDRVVESEWDYESEESGDTSLVLDTPGIAEDGRLTMVWLSGGIDGVTYHVTNTVVTQGGRTLQQWRRIKVSTDRLG